MTAVSPGPIYEYEVLDFADWQSAKLRAELAHFGASGYKIAVYDVIARRVVLERAGPWPAFGFDVIPRSGGDAGGAEP